MGPAQPLDEREAEAHCAIRLRDATKRVPLHRAVDQPGAASPRSARRQSPGASSVNELELFAAEQLVRAPPARRTLWPGAALAPRALRWRRGAGAARPRPGTSAISSVRRSGRRRSSTSESASSRRAVGQLVGEHARVGERVHRVAPVAEHERGIVNVRRSLRWRRDASKEQSLQQRAAGARFLADDVEQDVAVRAVARRAGPRARPRASSLHHRLAERQRDQQRRERERRRRAARCRARASRSPCRAGARGLRGDLQRGVRAERGAHHGGLARSRGGPSARRICSREDRHRVAPHVARAVGARRGRAGRRVITRLPRAASASASGRCICWESSSPWTRISGRAAAGALLAAGAVPERSPPPGPAPNSV